MLSVPTHTPPTFTVKWTSPERCMAQKMNTTHSDRRTGKYTNRDES